MLYDIIERQRLERAIIQGIEALLESCPAELLPYLRIPIARRIRSGSRPLQISVVSTRTGWYVSAGGFFPNHDTRWLTHLDMPELRACRRFLERGADIGNGLSVAASLRQAALLKGNVEVWRSWTAAPPRSERKRSARPRLTDSRLPL